MKRVLSMSFTALVLALSIFLPALALAQDTVPLPAPEPTVVGQLLSWLAVIALGAVTMLMSLVGVLLSKKAKDSRIFGAINSLWVLAQTVVAHVEADLRPKIAKALADGKLTPEEATELKLAAIAIFKQQAGTQLQEIQKLLGLNDSAIGTFISGLIERAVASIKKPGPVAAPTPAAPPNP